MYILNYIYICVCVIMCINTRYDMMLVFKRVAASNPKALWMVAFAKVGFSLT